MLPHTWADEPALELPQLFYPPNFSARIWIQAVHRLLRLGADQQPFTQPGQAVQVRTSVLRSRNSPKIAAGIFSFVLCGKLGHPSRHVLPFFKQAKIISINLVLLGIGGRVFGQSGENDHVATICQYTDPNLAIISCRRCLIQGQVRQPLACTKIEPVDSRGCFVSQKPSAFVHLVTGQISDPFIGGEPDEIKPVTRTRAPEAVSIHISEPTRLGMISYAVFCL